MIRFFRGSATFPVRLSAVLGICLLAVTILPTPVAAEYRLSIGDEVHVYVFGQKELDQRATVDGDGKIWVPTLGYMQAAGRTLKELRDSISSILTASEIIRSEDINVEVTKFRPFYIDGNVTNAGSYPYSLGLTVRQAIALAGGFAPGSADQDQQYLSQLVDERLSYQSLLSQYLQRNARVARVQAELQGKDHFEWMPPSNFSVSPEEVQRTRELEANQFKARLNSLDQRKAHLDEALRISADELHQLEDQYQRQGTDYEAVSKRLSVLEKLKNRGLTRAANVSAYEITVFLTRSRFDSTAVQLVRSKRDRQDLMAQREKIDIEVREELNRELQSAVLEMEALHSQMIAGANKLMQSNAIIERVCRPRQVKEGIIIHRQKNGRNKRFRTSQEGDVQPGDVIEVNIVDDVLRELCASRFNVGAASVKKHSTQ